MHAMDYARARLRTEDEARSAALDRDRRVWRPDPDEGGAVPCVICDAPVPSVRSGRGLLCPRCKAAGWTAMTCECGAPLTETDKKAKGDARWFCKRCREEMAP